MQNVFFLGFFLLGKREGGNGVRIRECCRSVGSILRRGVIDSGSHHVGFYGIPVLTGGGRGGVQP